MKSTSADAASIQAMSPEFSGTGSMILLPVCSWIHEENRQHMLRTDFAAVILQLRRLHIAADGAPSADD